MAEFTPEAISLRPRALTLLHHLLALPAPEEGCALLLGWRQGVLWRIERIWPCLNVWEPQAERKCRFAVDPREQLHAQKWGRGQELLLLGSAHSHPAAEPVPSATDRALTVAPALMLIRGCSTQGRVELACWWLPEDAPAWPLPWRMED
ncbi:M67 family metallopeptidase [Cyanobium sp. FGCU-52]|nr:M67 family metallopeptidase [Cyanobium sp. FGCU52]